MILIDLDKCYGCRKCQRAVPGLYMLVEKGIREAVCRRCVNPPCVRACPAGALEKTETGRISRLLMKCVSCKQCAAACPAGANPHFILRYRNFPQHRINAEKCAKICQSGAVSRAEAVPAGWTVIGRELAVKASGWE